LRHQDQVLRNITVNLLTYALGRGVEYDDMPTVRAILAAAAPGGYRLRGLIEGIVMSEPFRMNSMDSASPAAVVAAASMARTVGMSSYSTPRPSA
jgi:hypothetical protein